VTTTPIRFGRDLPGDDELRLCGDLGGGKRALELGVGRHRNALAMALTGARALAVDPDATRLDDLRTRAAELEVTVQCRHGDLADLGDTMSATIDLVVADHSLTAVDDLGRVLRQVHRVMKSSRPFVIAVPHPFAGVYTTDQYGSKVHPYGTVGRPIGDWFIQLTRANFRVDQILELGVSEIKPVPTTLVLRAVKEGD
jgi:ubiquinone/menaquinone biosynthesis C-methylase UbiE